MKGIIFNLLEDMVVAKCGMQVWNDLLAKHAPSDRVYISAKSSSEAELFSIVQDVALQLNLPVQEVVKAFGRFCLVVWHPDMPMSCSGLMTLVH